METADQDSLFPPDGFEYQQWKFGDDVGAKFVRPARRPEKKKRSVIYSEVKNLKLYDAPINIGEENLPPSNVILSSELAYKVLRFALTSRTLAKHQLHLWWPANFTTYGGPCEHIEPMGRAALLTQDDGSQSFGCCNGYTFAGSYGLTIAQEQVGSLQKARELKYWFKKERSFEGLTSTKDFAPENYDPLDPKNQGVADPERMKRMDKWPSWLEKERQALSFPPGIPSPTHPDNQPYWKHVKANIEARKMDGSFVSWKCDNPINPLKPLPAIHLPDPIRREKIKAGTRPLPPAATKALNDIFGATTILKDALKRYTDAGAGTLPIFPKQSDFHDWLRSYEATLVNQVADGTTHVVPGEVEHSNLMVKDANGLERSDVNFQSMSERADDTMGQPESPTSTDTDEPAGLVRGASSMTPNLEAKPVSGQDQANGQDQSQFRILLQHLSQLAHCRQLTITDTFESTDRHLEEQEARLERLQDALKSLGPGLTRDQMLELTREIVDNNVARRGSLRDGHKSLMKNMDYATKNIVRATSSASATPFTESMRTRAMAKGKKLPGKAIEDLKNPAAWFRCCETGDRGLESDVAKGLTVKEDYQQQQLPERATSKRKYSILDFRSPSSKDDGAKKCKAPKAEESDDSDRSI